MDAAAKQEALAPPDLDAEIASADELPLSDDLSQALAELFRALADANRAKMVHALAHHEMTTSALAVLLKMSLPGVSQHLRLLRLLRIVKPRREGRLVYYSLDDAHIRLLITLSLTHLQEEQSRHSAAVVGTSGEPARIPGEPGH